jgi:protein-tyrosine phosphatase
MIDIHSHILYGVDDGANDEAASLQMAGLYQELGFEKVVGASHIADKSAHKAAEADILARLAEMQAKVAAQGIGIELVQGAEYYLDRDFADIAEAHWPMIRINNSMFVLVEMPALFIPASIGLSFFNTKIKNPELKKLLPFLRLVIAHPERNEDVISKPESSIKRIKEQGVYIQMNLGSLVDYYGKTVRKAAEQILKLKMVDVIATDSHSPDQLRAIVPEGLKRLRKIAGEKAVEMLMKINPAKVLAGEPLEPFY